MCQALPASLLRWCVHVPSFKDGPSLLTFRQAAAPRSSRIWGKSSAWEQTKLHISVAIVVGSEGGPLCSPRSRVAFENRFFI